MAVSQEPRTIEEWKAAYFRMMEQFEDALQSYVTRDQDVARAVDSAIQPWREVDEAHRREIVALKAASEQARRALERIERALDHHDDGNDGPCGCVFHRVISAALTASGQPE